MKLIPQVLNALKVRLDRLNDIDTTAVIDCGSWVSGSSIHGDVTVSDGCKIYQATVAGQVTISRFSSLWGPGVFVLGRKYGISIGSFCSIARYVSIQEDNHELQRTTTYFVEKNIFEEQPEPSASYSRGKIEIGNDVWIGAGAQIHSGIHIGNGAVIAGGAIVTKDVPPFAIVAGNPARVMRYRFDDTTIAKLLDDEWWSWPLDRIKAERDYLIELHARPD